MFSAPTAIRVLKKQDPAFLSSTTCRACGCCSLRRTARRADGALDL